MRKKEKVSYLTRDRANDLPDVKALKWVSKFVEGDYVQCYCNVVGVLTGLTPCATTLLFYLTTVMDERNYVRNTKVLKVDFNKIIEQQKSKGFSDTAINRAFKLLKEKKVLYRLHKRRGLYKLNPIYFFKGSKEARIRETRFDLERPIAYLASKLRGENFEKDKERKKIQKNAE